jgi:hypothetical protein
VAAPTVDNWTASGENGNIHYTGPTGVPDGVSQWQFRYREDAPIWNVCEPTEAYNGDVALDIGEGDAEVQMRWFAGSAGGLPSDWSASQVVNT